MEQSFNELERDGKGVEVDDVVAAPRAPARSGAQRTGRMPSRRAQESDFENRPTRSPQRRSADTGERERDASGRFLPQSDDDEPNMVDVLVDNDEDAPQQSGTRRGRRAPAPVDDDDFDDDDLDAYAEDDDDTSADSDDDADEVEGDTLAPEGDDTDEDDEGEERPSRSQRTRSGKPPKVDRETEKWMAKQIEKRVGDVIQERDALRETEQRNREALAANQQFFQSVLGTDERLRELEATVLNTALPTRQRDEAAQVLQRYKGNREFAAMYQRGLMTVIQQQQAIEDQEALKQFEQLQALDPNVIREGNRAKTLIHAYRVGMEGAEKKLRQRYGVQFKRMRDELETLRGSRDEQRVRGGLSRRETLASSSGRRANGRRARTDPMRGVLSNQPGIRNGSTMAAPTDDVLQRIKDGELTLADIGLGRIA